ncbi:type II toxin-antitoxin system RelE/ParE family toxin [Candidatus Saccharibacteria bacterium]|nr:type II toxin-antitoxin system RelE/ParE family toxin [Candidatus Saccharibacteria bacterium]
MKKYVVKMNDQADFDLLQIYDYIYNVLENPLAAKKVTNGILDKCAKLAFFPEANPAHIMHDKYEFRFSHFGNYTAIYIVNSDKHEVIIYRIVYSRRNIKLLLNS